MVSVGVGVGVSLGVSVGVSLGVEVRVWVGVRVGVGEGNPSMSNATSRTTWVRSALRPLSSRTRSSLRSRLLSPQLLPVAGFVRSMRCAPAKDAFSACPTPALVAPDEPPQALALVRSNSSMSEPAGVERAVTRLFAARISPKTP